jgi:sugar lactone lactonase YvrE
MTSRNYIVLTLALLTLAVTAPNTRAQSIYSPPYAFTNFAGLPGVGGSADGTGSAARFGGVRGLAMDSAGNLYTGSANTIRKITTPGAVVTTLAGTPGVTGSADGNGPDAQFHTISGVAVDTNGNVYVSDYLNHTIRKLDTAGNVTTLAGSPGVPGNADGNVAVAQFKYPEGLAIDSAGNLFVADELNHAIRKITPAGNVTTPYGSSGVPGSADGIGSAARFYYPNGLAVDSADNLYVADTVNDTIRKITPAGVVTTLAGTPTVAGSADGIGSAARFNYTRSCAVDSAGNVYVGDEYNRTIRRVTPAGVVTTLGGTPGVAGSADGYGGAALFAGSYGVVAASAGTVYVADGNRITKGTLDTQPRLISAKRDYLQATSVSVAFNQLLVAATATNLSNYALNNSGTISGASLNSDRMTVVLTTSPLFNNVKHILTVNNVQATYSLETIATNSQITVLVPPISGQSIYTPYAFTNFAGLPGVAGSANGTGTNAHFYRPHGVAVDSAGNVYTADTDTNTIRKITSGGVVTTLAGTAGVAGSADGTGTNALFNGPTGVAVDSAGNLYVADYFNFTIRKIDTAENVTTLAGSPGVPGSADGNGGGALFRNPNSVAVDSAGNLYVADELNQTIRMIDTNANVTTLAGSPGQQGSADGTGSAARFKYPNGMAVDSAGNLYTADTVNNTIRKITPAGVVTTLAGSAGVAGSADGTGSDARFNSPRNVAVDSAGNVYVADEGNRTIRQITSAGAVTTLAGSPGVTGSTDGVGSAARFNTPWGVAVDSAGNVYVADYYNDRITKGIIAPLTVVSAARDYLQATLVSVVFNHSLVAATATNLSNYALNNSGTISGATVNVDGRTVVLTTSPLFNNVTHILTVNNVQAANGLTLATNSQIAISVPGDTIRTEYGLGGTNRLLVLEAEHYNLNSPGGGSSWIFTTAPPLLKPTDANTNFSGDGAMLAVPVIGRNLGSPALGSVPADSPRLDFTVQFTNTGTFYVWVRGVGDSAPGPSTNDSVFIGLDNALTTGITGFPLGQGYAWANSPAGNSGPIVISTPGFHLINVWMREDGFTVDKLLLTSDRAFTPTGPVITVTRSGTGLIQSWPGGGTLQSSTNVVGPYVDIPGSSSPFNVVPAGAQNYYRVRQ